MRGKKVRATIALVVVGAAIGIYALVSSAAPTVPAPDPIVMVHTESGGVVRDTPVPIGGVPVPIDVDNGSLLGILSPDIDVSVGLVALDENPAVVVPNIVVKRDPLAQLRHAPSPPLKLNARVILYDVGNVQKLATIDYGFETPPGARIPPIVTAKLTGPITSGFVDPLKAKIETPGYGGPLKFNIRAQTSSFDGTFGLKFDPLPEAIVVNEDPQDNGLQFTYDHVGATPDVRLDATADLKDLGTGRLRHIRTSVDRLPNHIQFTNTSAGDQTLIDYQAGAELGKPDVDADYRDTLSNGKVVTDANVKVSGLPSHLRATVDTKPADDGTTDIDGVTFNALDGGVIDAVDFVARNYTGDPGNVPQYDLGPEQFVSMATRRQADGSSRFRAAGRLRLVRGGSFKRTGDNRDKLDIQTDVGDGATPLRGILDMDNRGAPASDDPKRLFVDSTVSPLPANLHVQYEPGGKTDPQHLVYDSSSQVNVDTSTVIAKAAADGCGQDRVICAQARIDKLPPHMDVKLPAEGGTDFSISHNGAASSKPDVRATVDVGPDASKTPASPRTWARAALLRVPNEVRGRLDTRGGDLRAAEFHGCDWDFDATDPGCKDTQGAIGRVTFTVRDQPERAGLPPRPDTADQAVTVLSRHHAPGPKHFEVNGRVDEVRNVAFRQLDTKPGDGKTDGVLGALVDVGVPHDAAHPVPFDVVVDDVDDAFDDSKDPAPIVGDDAKAVAVHVFDLPLNFSACVRSTAEVAPPDPGSLPKDKLLEPCESTDVVSPGTGEHVVTPMSASYTATDLDGNPSPTKVEAHVRSTKPDLGDLDAIGNPFPSTTALDLTIDKVPASLRADVIPPVTPAPATDTKPAVAGRRMQVVYQASSQIDSIRFALQSRHDNNICEDPRPSSKAMCLSGELKNLPANDDSKPASDPEHVSARAEYDPDDSKGKIELFTAKPATGDVSLDDLHLSRVAPDKETRPLVLDGYVHGITRHLLGHIQSLELDGENPPTAMKLADQLATCHDGEDNDGDRKADDPAGAHIDAQDSDCGKDPARISFDACPDDDPQNPTCPGIGEISFTASDALVGDPVPPVAPADPPLPGTDPHQEFSFVQSGDDFRANGLVRNFKRLSYSRVDESGAPSRVTRLGAAFGNGDPLRAYVDRDTGKETQKLDAVITDAPQTIDICMRDDTVIDDLKDDGDFCERKKADRDDRTDEDKLAMQAKLEAPVPGDHDRLPDIDVRSFEVSKGGGAEVVAGKVNIQNLAQRVDMLVGKGSDTEVLVEGHNRDDGRTADPVDIADRVTFSFRTFKSLAGLTAFPWTPLDGPISSASLAGDVDPKDDPDNGPDPATRNYLQVFKNFDGRVLAEGSVPHIKQIQLEPRPCVADTPDDADAVRFPTSGFTPVNQPKYTCVRASAAAGEKLGLAVRTLDRQSSSGTQDALSLEQGHISAMPKSISATIVKIPDGLKTEPLCGRKKDGSVQAPPCRPPLISMEAPRDGAPGVLDGKLATGDRNLLYALRTTQPDDPMSAKGDFEAQPRTWAEDGARVKVGTDDDGNTAMRVGLRIPIPRFLDLDPVMHYSCSAVTPSPGPNCDEKFVGKGFNHGYESTDLALRLVAADDKHLGNPPADHPYLGRVEALITPLLTETAKQQIVITGMPDPDGKDPIKHHPTPGASSVYAEDFPDVDDPSNFGFRAPAHLDAKVWLRNDYNATDGGKNQEAYSQVDGRVNAPLSMAMRLIDRTPPPTVIAGHEFHSFPSANRNGSAVPAVQLTLRNAASSNNTDNYGDPTFRVRSQLATSHQSQDEIFPTASEFFLCSDDGIGIGIPDIAQICLLLPKHAQNRYLDVQLNGDPGSTGWTTGDAARTIDAVGGPFGSENNIEVRGWKEINGTGGPEGKGTPAPVTPVGALRLTNFEVGLRGSLGVGIVGASLSYEQVGDLIVGLAGHAMTRTRLSTDGPSAELSGDSPDSSNYVNAMADMKSDVRIKLSIDIFFGAGSIDIVNVGGGGFSTDVDFHNCDGADGTWPDNEFWTGDNVGPSPDPQHNVPGQIIPGPGHRKAGMNLGLDSALGLSTEIINILSNLTPACTFWDTHTDPLVTQQEPAPTFTNEGHLVDDAGQTNGSSSDPTPPPPDTTKPNLLIPGGTGPSTSKTLCGAYDFDRVIVFGHLGAGAPGATDENGHACDGNLTINANEITVGPGGDITADGLITGGPGTPGSGSGSGGGAGHATEGGRSGRDKAGFIGPGGPAYDVPAGGHAVDFGSEGRLGTGAAGKGGGTLVLSARDLFDNDGTISARGSGGGDAPLTAPTLCRTGGGGGSGGAVLLASNIISGSGDVTVQGGDGGVGGWGGGGGAAGRMTIHAVAFENHLNFAGGRGYVNDPNTFCDPGTDSVPRQSGDNGGNGEFTDDSQNPPRIAKAELASSNPGPYTSDNPKLDLTAIQAKAHPTDDDAGPLEIVLCHRQVAFSDDNPFADPGLDPPGSTVQDWLDNSDCDDFFGFSKPTDGDYTYKVTTPALDLATDVYGFFAYARRPVCGNIATYIPSSRKCRINANGVTFTPSYQDQTILPPKAGAKIGVDHEQPTADPSALNKDGDCVDGSLCLRSGPGLLDPGAHDTTGGSGVAAVECRVWRADPSDGTFQSCNATPYSAGLAPGINHVDVRVVDRAGNTFTADDAVQWFLDVSAPDKPVVHANFPPGSAVNGWHHSPPPTFVTGHDPDPSSGYPDDPINLFVDEAKVPCGGSGSFTGDPLCSDSELANHQPPVIGQGEHVLTATSSDKAGYTSPISDPVTVKIDSQAPVSRFFIGPKTPDGGGQWYRTRPFIAFAAKDTPGGSGVDPSQDADNVGTDLGTGVHFSVDGRPFHLYDAEQAPILADGVHTVCWYAVDLAGNREDADPNAGGEQNHCSDPIKVDSTAPAATDAITPAGPDGNNSFYIAKPTVDPKGSDPLGPDPDRPSGLADQSSGIDRVQYQVDDGPWTTAAPFQVAEGEHEIRVRAFDVAGNAAPIRERTVRVDLSKPSATLGAFPPNANGQGWFRRERTDSVAVRDDRDGSGADGATYAIDAGGPISYLTPFSIGEGSHSATVKPRDRAGLIGPAVAQASKIDLTAPVATPSSTAPSPILISLLGVFGTTTLNYTVTDNLAPRVKVSVMIYDTLGTLVRRIPVTGPFPGGYSATGGGSVVWNGRNDANKGVLPGTYHFRVQAIDQAGNSVVSTESPVFLVIQGILPL